MALKWNGAAIQKKIEAEMARRLDASAILVTNHARVLIGREGTAKVGRGKSARLIYGARHSVRGEPPMKQTGRLQSSVAWERDGMVARVGTSVGYGRTLQMDMDRPWLDRALREKTNQIRAIISKPMDF